MNAFQAFNEKINPQLRHKRIRLEKLNQFLSEHSTPISDRHPHFETCPSCKTNQWALVSVIKQNGIKVVKSQCLNCAESSGQFPIDYIDPELCPIWTDHRSICCMRCGALEAEMHHYAPRHLFDDSDEWGTIPLCREHHRIWHKIVTPNMSQPKFKGAA
jgi:hypothetical protein